MNEGKEGVQKSPNFEQKANSWMSVLASRLKSNVDAVQSRLDDASQKIETNLSNFNKAYREKSANIAPDSSGKRDPKALLEIFNTLANEHEYLEEIEKNLKFVEATTDTSVIAQKINKLKKRLARFETLKQQTQETHKQKLIAEQQEQIRQKQYTLQMRDVYKNDLNILDTTLQGQKVNLLHILAHRSNPDIPITSNEYSINISGQRVNISQELEKFWQDLQSYKSREKIYDPSTKNIEQSEKNKLKALVDEERKRYRTSAELQSYLSKIKAGEYLSVEKQSRLLDLLDQHINQSTKSTGRSELDVVKTLVEQSGFEINTLKTQLDRLKSHYTENSATINQLKSATDIATRQKITRQMSADLKNQLNDNSDLIRFFEATKYENQIKTKLREIIAPDASELIQNLQEMQIEFAKECEIETQIEKEGPIEYRIEQAKNLIRRRILQDFSSVERVRALFGDKSFEMWDHQGFDRNRFVEDIQNLKSNLLAEIEGKYNISPKDGSHFEDIRLQIEEIFENTKISNEFVRKINSDKNSMSEFKTKLVEDMAFAKLMANMPDRVGATSPKALDPVARDVLQKYRQEAENLLQDPKNYVVIPTPNSITVALKDTRKLDEFLLGDKLEDKYLPESVAATLKFGQNTQEMVSKNTESNYTGKILLVSAQGDERDIMHETEHALMHTLDTRSERPNSLNPKIEELAIHLASGAMWEELSMPQNIHQKENISLAALAYITEVDMQTQKDKIEKLLQIVEYTKEMMQDEVEQFNPDSVSELIQNTNITGQIVANLLTSYRSQDGEYDIDTAFLAVENMYKKHKGIQQKSQAKQLDKYSLYGIDPQDPDSENKYQILNKKYTFISKNQGFDFDVVAPMDLRGRTNVTFDSSFDPKAGAGGAPSKIVGPLGYIPGASLIYKLSGKEVLPTTDEYNVATGLSNLWPINFFNYRHRSRAWGGILRSQYDKPWGGIVKWLAPEQKTKFGTNFAKIFNDLPPFGRGWEQTIKDFLPGAQEYFKNKYPGREDSIESRTPNAFELWRSQIQILAGNLGDDGIGLNQQQMQRVLGELPGIAYESEFGRLKFGVSRGNFEELDEEGFHRGRIKRGNGNRAEFLDDLQDLNSEFRQSEKHPGRKPAGWGADRAKWEKDMRKYNKSKKLNFEVERLGLAMHNAYDRDNYSYTINDLISAAQTAHDLGINPLDPRKVRNDYYGEQHGDKFVKKGNLMISDHIWYDTTDSTNRGVVVIQADGTRELFDLAAANELIRRYNIFHIDRALREGVDEITTLMQQNEFQPDKDKRIILPNNQPIQHSQVRDMYQNPVTRQMIEPYIQPGMGGFQPSPDYAWYYDANLQDHVLCEVARVGNTGHKIRNRFYSVGFGATGIPGVSGSPRTADFFKFKTLEDFASHEGGLAEGFAFADDWVQRLDEISKAERWAYYSKTFWEDTRSWVQKIGNVVLYGSLAAMALGGSPTWAGIFLGWAAFQFPFVYIAQMLEKRIGAQRNAALKLQQELGGQSGMYDRLFKGQPLNRLETWYYSVINDDNMSKIEDWAKIETPPNQYPGGDFTHKLFLSAFGKEGYLGQALK